MTTVHEALEQFEQKAAAARTRYWRAIREGGTAKEAGRGHDPVRQQAFIDLMGQVRERQAELAGLLDESQWRSLRTPTPLPATGPSWRTATPSPATSVPGSSWANWGTWTLGRGRPTGRTSNAAMNALIRRGS